MAQNHWEVDGTLADLVGAQPAPQPGQSEPYELWISPVADPDVPPVRERYRALRDRAKHAGTVHIETTIDDRVIYNVGVGDADPLVEIVPGDYDPTGRAIWGLIIDVDDETENTEARATLTLEIAYVAAYDEYPDKQAVRDAHERRGFH